MVQGGKIWKNLEYVFLSQVRKNWARRKNIILFHLKLISKRLSRKVGKANTIQHDQREKQTQGERI
jgi:hypothetical protein